MPLIIGILIGIYIATVGIKTTVDKVDGGVKKVQEFIVEKNTSNNSNPSK